MPDSLFNKPPFYTPVKGPFISKRWESGTGNIQWMEIEYGMPSFKALHKPVQYKR